MSGYSITIQVADDVKAKFAGLPAITSPGLSRVMGAAAAGVVSSHLLRLDGERANTMGGKRSHFYADAAKHVSHTSTTDGATVLINKVGLRQRWLGGTITAVNSKYLTIPARAEAYGVPARQFPGKLRFIPTQRGGMLVKVTDWEGKAAKQKSDYLAGKRVKAARRDKSESLVVYWLVPSVYQKPDPSVLPSSAVLTLAVQDAANKYLRGFNV